MGKDTYKKRMKGNWNQGKGCKGDDEERMYAKEEIRQALKEMDDDYQATYKKSKRKRNEKARLEHSIAWYEKVVAEDERRQRENPDRGSWRCSFISYARDALRKAKKEYAEKFGEKT